MVTFRTKPPDFPNERAVFLVVDGTIKTELVDQPRTLVMRSRDSNCKEERLSHVGKIENDVESADQRAA
jgi:hypothetical protein